MKTLYLYLIALMTAFAMPALAGGDATETRTELANGCVLIDRGGYLAYERGCPVASSQLQQGGSGYVDTDADGIADTYRPDARNR